MTQRKLENVKTDQIIPGIKKSLSNASNLIRDADVLFEAGRIPRAYCLYQLAVEEVGKSRLLFSLLLDKKLSRPIDFKEYNTEFSRHELKSGGAIVFEKIALLLMYSNEERQQNKEQIIQMFKANEEGDSVDVLNHNKNLSLYVSISDKGFQLPEDVITIEMAQKIRQKAVIRFKASSSFMEVFLSNIHQLITGLKEVADDPNIFRDDKWAELIIKSRSD